MKLPALYMNISSNGKASPAADNCLSTPLITSARTLSYVALLKHGACPWQRSRAPVAACFAHPFCVPCRHVKLLRVVIREDLSMSMAEELIKDFERVVEYLDHHFSFTDDQVGYCSFAASAWGLSLSRVCSALVRVGPGMFGIPEHLAGFTQVLSLCPISMT